TRGHSAAANAFGVAATPAASPFGVSPPNPTGPYPLPFNAANTVELFSSDGPRRIFFDGAGNLLPGAPPCDFTVTGGVIRDKPDVTAADGVATSAPGFNPFFGTSAAAPHAAAIAALLRQAFPTWTSAQLRTALTGAAIDIHAPGWDRDSGAGIVMPLAALQAAGAPAIPALVLQAVASAEVHGNGNGQADAGEDWRLDITLGNTGGIAAAGTVATLLAHTPGVAVTSAPIAYGDIAVNGSAANPPATPFRFSIFDIVCGQDLDFTLSVTTADSPVPHVFPIRIPTVLVTGSPQTFSYTGPSVAIPDASPEGDPGATVAAGLAVAGVPAPVGSVKLRIDGLNSCMPNNAANAGVDHTFVGDLLLELRSPGGATIPVVNQIGGGGGTGKNFCNTTLDDQSPNIAIGTAAAVAAPYTGSYKPDARLGAFLGTNANGTWELRATDKGPEDSGHINRFSLIVAPAACTSVAANVAITAAKSVSGAYYPGGAVTYTVTLSNTGTGAQADNPGDEYADMLPATLTVVPAATMASAGAIAVTGNTVRWNGAIAAGASVTLTLAATINPGTLGAVVVSQGAAAFDADHDGSNESAVFTDDPLVGGTADPTVFTVGPPTLDIDGNGSYDALTDGLLVIRHLFGLTGAALVEGAIGVGAARTTPAAILDYLSGLGPQLDIDGNDDPDALTDGLLALRYMFGLRGPALVAGAIGIGAARSSPEDVEAFLTGVMP
ncbi:MAG: S8 family serine peptidase, partial [Burkholderiales bacterium]|nr:S8 family serine peptidase [Burkholderiales bacterium]